jgi:hypothetical protein
METTPNSAETTAPAPEAAGTTKSRATRFANTVLGFGGLWFAAHAGFAWQLGRTNGVIVTFAVGAALLLAALLLKPGGRVNVALLALPLLLGIHGFEWRMARMKPAAASAATAAGRPWDNRAIAEVIDDFAREGKPGVPVVQPKPIINTHKGVMKWEGQDLLPLGGISNVFTVFCNEGGAWTNFESDEHGFVNPRGQWSAEATDVALVGDSFTQGACVPVEQTFAGLVRAAHPRTINIGMGGNGPLLELAGIREYLSHVKPKHVLWLYFRNDLDDLNVEKRVPLLKRYLEDGFSQKLFGDQARIDAALKAMVEKRAPHSARWPKGLASVGLTRQSTPVWIQDLVMGEDHSSTAAVLRLDQLSAIFQFKTGGMPPDFELFETILTKARAEVAAWGGTLHFVYLPDLWYLGKNKKDHPLRQKVLASVKKVGLPLCDAHARFEEEPDLEALRYHPLAHYSPAGYAVVGRILNAYLDSLPK